MTKAVLNDVVNPENQTSTANTINANNAVIETAFDNTLSRDGAYPNQMQTVLDMNSNQIINLPSPSTNFSPLRLVDFSTLSNISGAIAGSNVSITGPTVSVIPNPNFATSVTSPFLNINFNGVGTTIPASATLAKFFDGSSGSPHTANTPSISISRYDSLSSSTLSGNSPAIFIDVHAHGISTGVGTGPSAGNPNSAGIVSNIVQLGSGDVVGLAASSEQASPTAGFTSYGTFSIASASTAGSALYGVNSLTSNNTGTNHSYVYLGLPLSAGILNQALGTNRTAVGVLNQFSGQPWDVGFANGSSSVLSAGFVDDSNSISILSSSSSHSYGINLQLATCSQAAFISPGFYINGSGDVVGGNFSICATSNLPTGGQTGLGVNLSVLSHFGIYFGVGVPTLQAAKGSLYMRNDGGTSTNRLYINTDSGTTWTAVNTVA